MQLIITFLQLIITFLLPRKHIYYGGMEGFRGFWPFDLEEKFNIVFFSRSVLSFGIGAERIFYNEIDSPNFLRFTIPNNTHSFE